MSKLIAFARLMAVLSDQLESTSARLGFALVIGGKFISGAFIISFFILKSPYLASIY